MPNKSHKIQQHYCRNMTLMHVFLHTILWMNFFYYSHLRNFFCVGFLVFFLFFFIFIRFLVFSFLRFYFVFSFGGLQNLISPYVCLKLNLLTLEYYVCSSNFVSLSATAMTYLNVYILKCIKRIFLHL